MNISIVDALEKNDSMLPDASGSFAAEYQLDLHAVHVEVKDFGAIHFPLAPADMQQLLKMASLAKFGLREKTLLNTEIRDTYEIPGSQLTIQLDDKQMTQMLSGMHQKIGLSENTNLSAHLHNLLIYTPGQFFKPHQDTEKLEGMIATLVIVLPSSHIGGDLIINHKNGRHRFSSENLNAEKLRCVAFYSDCHHEVQEVKQGHRIALTYNLVLQSKNNKKNMPITRAENTALEQSLKAYFAVYDNAPQTMTYFLNHEYTEHSLQWEMLKGVDIKNAQALRYAAEKLNLKAHLALVEVHESWSTDGYDEEDSEPVDLIDSDTTLSFWRDKNNQLLPYEKYTVNDKEIFWTKDTEEFSPTDKEYEGYMGNYGGNVDYWYRRAAVVLWKQDHQTAMEFQLSYDIAFADLINLIKISGNEAQVSSIVESAGDYIYRSKYRIEENNLSLFLQIAYYIQNDAIALKLLSPFRLTQLHRDLIKHLVLFQEKYGLEWCLQLLQAWNNSSVKAAYGIPGLIDYIDCLALESVNLKFNNQLIAFLLEYQIDVLLKKDGNLINRKLVEIKQERNNTVSHSIAFLKACRLLKDGASFFKK